MRRRVTIALLVLTVTLVSLLGLLVLALGPPRLDVPDRRDWVFRDVVLVEPGRSPRPRSTLRIESGVIVESGGRPRSRTSPPSDAVDGAEVDRPPSTGFADTTDLAGLYVSPGLSDLHVHYPPKVAVGHAELWSLLLLAHGVTSIRETGSIDGTIFEVRRAIRGGRYPGPRVFACGAMLDGRRPSFPSNRVVATPQEARKAVADLAAEGADCIKAYNMLSPAALSAIREAASEVGIPVIGHAPHSVSLEEAGLVDLQHGTGVVLVDRERVARSDFRAADWVSVDQARIDYAARVSLDQGIAHTPTLVNARMRRLLTDARLVEQAMAQDSGLRHLPRFWPAVWATIWSAPFVAGDAESEALEQLFRSRQAMMTARLHEAGVRIHAGTDTLMPFVAPGSSLHGELDDLVAAGIAREDVWEIATRRAGHSLGLEGLGTLEVGAPADLVFLRADPAGDLGALREIEAVMADGRLYRRTELDAMLATTDAHFHGAVYSAVMGAVIALVQHQFAPEHDASGSLGAQP